MDISPQNENDEFAELVNLRRIFHKNPEVGFAEFWTTARICEYLSALDCQLLYGDELKSAFSDKKMLAQKLEKLSYPSPHNTDFNDEWMKVKSSYWCCSYHKRKRAWSKNWLTI